MWWPPGSTWLPKPIPSTAHQVPTCSLHTWQRMWPGSTLRLSDFTLDPCCVSVNSVNGNYTATDTLSVLFVLPQRQLEGSQVLWGTLVPPRSLLCSSTAQAGASCGLWEPAQAARKALAQGGRPQLGSSPARACRLHSQSRVRSQFLTLWAFSIVCKLSLVLLITGSQVCTFYYVKNSMRRKYVFKPLWL